LEAAHTANRLISAATAGDFERLRALVAGGADVNACDQFGDSVLTVSIGDPDNEDMSLRLAIANELLQLGADPCQTGEDGDGPLCVAAVRMDIDVLRLLIDAGARPNEESGWDPNMTLYDLALDSYFVRIWLMESDKPGIPEVPDEQDLGSEDTWLNFLDRMAVKYGKPRPSHLFFLRERGARTKSELDSQA
jgi:hypothetical protein